MSSKTARLHHRQAARRRTDKRLRKSGRVPQHSRAERRQAATERQQQHEADQRRQARLRRVVLPVVASAGATSIMFLPLAQASSGHNSSLYLSAAYLTGPGSPDLPHMPEPDMTFYSPLIAASTATTNVLVGPVPSEPWDGSERYGPYGPNIFGD